MFLMKEKLYLSGQGTKISIWSKWSKQMKNPKFLKNQSVVNAICIGGLCSVSYLAVYFAKNIFSAAAPKMLASGFDESFIGTASFVYLICYALGQLINGRIGDKIKSRYMISLGLLLSGITNFIFANVASVSETAAIVFYGMTGYFLSMIYGSITKVVAENTELVYATRCSMGYTFASFIGSPMAGVAAAALTWQGVFMSSTAALGIMAIVCFAVFLVYEKKGIVKYNQFKPQREEKGYGVKVLIKRQIIKFTFIAIITGVIRTSVVFWMPTYITQYLGFAPETSASVFTVATFVISFTTFIAIFIYEKLGRNMDKTILIMFSLSAVFFALTYFVRQPALNIILLVLGIMASGGSATMLYSRYCPSLCDTGMVSSVTGYIDFISYMAAAMANKLFAGAPSAIGWNGLILVWFGVVALGVIIALPYKKKA